LKTSAVTAPAPGRFDWFGQGAFIGTTRTTLAPCKTRAGRANLTPHALGVSGRSKSKRSRHKTRRPVAEREFSSSSALASDRRSEGNGPGLRVRRCGVAVSTVAELLAGLTTKADWTAKTESSSGLAHRRQFGEDVTFCGTRCSLNYRFVAIESSCALSSLNEWRKAIVADGSAAWTKVKDSSSSRALRRWLYTATGLLVAPEVQVAHRAVRGER